MAQFHWIVKFLEARSVWFRPKADIARYASRHDLQHSCEININYTYIGVPHASRYFRRDLQD